MSGRRESSASRASAHPSISASKEAIESQRRRDRASPDLASWKKEFGDKVKVDEKTGEFEIKLNDRRDIRRAHEMQEDARKEVVERGALVQSRQKREKVVKSDGSVIDFPEDLVDNVKHRFKGGAGRNGMAVPLRFSMSGVRDIPVWTRQCSVCGHPHGMWRQWTKPECDDPFTCDDCGGEGDWFWDRSQEE